MKYITLFLLIGLALSYNRNSAVNYAQTYCSRYNSNYHNYASVGGDCANFVSQCMIAGGMSFSSCSVSWIDDKGCLPRVSDLRSCLSQKGWKSSSSLPGSFKAGYPLFLSSGSHAMIAVSVSGSTVYYAAHTNDRCNQPISSGVIYYYE